MLTAKEAARRLNVKLPTLYAYVSRGMIERHVAPGGRASRFDAADVERLAKRARRAPRAGTDPADTLITTELTAIVDGRLLYRGRDAVALSVASSFEEVAEWLWTGEEPVAARWPTDDRAVATGAAAARALPASARTADRLRVIAAAVAAHDGLRYDLRPASVVVSARLLLNHLVECLPALRPVPSHRRLADRLWARLTDRTPFAGALDLVNRALVLIADHELAASTFAVRVAASTRADPYSVVGAGLGALGGPLHGSASEAVHRLFTEAAARGDAAAVVADRLREGLPLPGFGQYLYPNGDPRGAALLEHLHRSGAPRRARSTVAAVQAAASERVTVHPNVDFAMGALTFAAGMRADAGEAIFAIGRIAGWIAHAMEEYAAPPLRWRPRALYVGPS